MKCVTSSIVAIVGLCVLSAGVARAGCGGHSYGGHYHYIPHTETHVDLVPHGDHYHAIPHTTTHFDPVWHDASGHHFGAPPVANVIPINSIPPTSVPAIGLSGNVVPGDSRGGTILLENPSKNGGAVRYRLNAFAYTANPGDAQALNNDRLWTISFDNGRGTQVSHRLDNGQYRFQVDNAAGWTLVRVEDGVAPPPPTASVAN